MLFRFALLRVVSLASALFVPAAAQEILIPLPVCEALHQLDVLEKKPALLAGRYARRAGHAWLGQDHCPESVRFELSVEPDAPPLPQNATLDRGAANLVLAQLRLFTALQSFRFGSPDYDRYALVYGTVRRTASGLKLVFRGDGVVYFYPAQ